MAAGRPEAVLIAGPTASGKSALALALAKRLGGVIVNADSAQVYNELRIITARPSASDEAMVEHRLYGHRPVSESYSVAVWLTEVAELLMGLRHTGCPAIIVGGTGLYFRALTEGLAAIPAIPADVRSYWRSQALKCDPGTLHAELLRRDPISATRLKPTDSQRIIRALEVLEATGRSLTSWQTEGASPPLLPMDRTRRFVIEVDRGQLHTRIDDRFLAMIAAGALEEARLIASLDLDQDLPAVRAIGVRPLMAAVRGELDLPEAIKRAQAESRQYAKRQITWQRHQMADWTRIAADISIDEFSERHLLDTL